MPPTMTGRCVSVDTRLVPSLHLIMVGRSHQYHDTGMTLGPEAKLGPHHAYMYERTRVEPMRGQESGLARQR